jgi:hypothetical protein
VANFKALDSGSQGSTKPVLFVDNSAARRDLMDAADWRLGAVRELLSVLSTCRSDDSGPRDLASASRALLLLVEDAEALFDAARQAA